MIKFMRDLIEGALLDGVKLRQKCHDILPNVLLESAGNILWQNWSIALKSIGKPWLRFH